MGIADYSKTQLKLQGSQFEEYWSKPHPSDYPHLLQHTSQTALLHYADYWSPVIMMQQT